MAREISIEDRQWAEKLHLSEARIEEMRQNMLENQRVGRYIFYGEDVNAMDAAEVIVHHTNMVNYLVDARTHDF